MDDDVRALFDRHRQSSCPWLEAAECAANAGHAVARTKPLPVDALAKVYQIRAEWVGRHAGDGARALAHELHLFVGALERHPGSTCTLWSVTRPDGLTFVLAEEASTGALLGCLRTLDARVASPVAQESFWGVAAEQE